MKADEKFYIGTTRFTNATYKEFNVACCISSFVKSFSYQRKENPVQIIANLLELKL